MRDLHGPFRFGDVDDRQPIVPIARVRHVGQVLGDHDLRADSNWREPASFGFAGFETSMTRRPACPSATNATLRPERPIPRSREFRRTLSLGVRRNRHIDYQQTSPIHEVGISPIHRNAISDGPGCWKFPRHHQLRAHLSERIWRHQEQQAENGSKLGHHSSSDGATLSTISVFLQLLASRNTVAPPSRLSRQNREPSAKPALTSGCNLYRPIAGGEARATIIRGFL